MEQQQQQQQQQDQEHIIPTISQAAMDLKDQLRNEIRNEWLL